MKKVRQSGDAFAKICKAFCQRQTSHVSSEMGLNQTHRPKTSVKSLLIQLMGFEKNC